MVGKRPAGQTVKSESEPSLRHFRRLLDPIDGHLENVMEEESPDFEIHLCNTTANTNSLEHRLREWYFEHRPSTESCTSLLTILRSEGLDVPPSVDELLGRKQSKDQLQSTVDVVVKDVDIIKNELIELKNMVRSQSELFCGLMASEENSFPKVRLGGGYGMDFAKYMNRFPLKSTADLAAIEESINDETTDTMVSTVRMLIRSGGIIKNLENVLSPAIILSFNVDGKQHKKRIQDYSKFVEVLFRASYEDGITMKIFLDDLRKGFRLAKNRHYKNSSKDNTND